MNECPCRPMDGGHTPTCSAIPAHERARLLRNAVYGKGEMLVSDLETARDVLAELYGPTSGVSTAVATAVAVVKDFTATDSIDAVAADVEKHVIDNPTHGWNCACHDAAIRRLRLLLTAMYRKFDHTESVEYRNGVTYYGPKHKTKMALDRVLYCAVDGLRRW